MLWGGSNWPQLGLVKRIALKNTMYQKIIDRKENVAFSRGKVKQCWHVEGAWHICASDDVIVIQHPVSEILGKAVTIISGMLYACLAQ